MTPEEIATALSTRDIGAVFRFLQHRGISQRRIGHWTGQSQSEISEIVGGRSVIAYDVLVRIAVGLGIPRGRLGLAYDNSDTVSSIELAPQPVSAAIPSAKPEPEPEPDWMPLAARAAPMYSNDGQTITLGYWTGLHIQAMREAMRLSVREFAAYLGISDRMVSKWEANSHRIHPRPVNQHALDTCLKRTDEETRIRFTSILRLHGIAALNVQGVTSNVEPGTASEVTDPPTVQAASMPGRAELELEPSPEPVSAAGRAAPAEP